MPTPKIEPIILQAAIELFGTHGPYGVTFQDLARKARVTSASIYRIFSTREGLFDRAVKTVLARSLAPADFLLMIFQAEGADFPSRVETAVRAWYASISQADARLLMQASFLGHKWPASEGPAETIVKVLATVLERERKTLKAPKAKKGEEHDPAAAARALIFSLFHLKLTLPPSARNERETMEGILSLWLKVLAIES
jgi:AcrR family transcriptional regulator